MATLSAVPTMDLFAGELARDSGIAQAADCRNALVNQIREYLTTLAKSRPTPYVTADDYEPFLRSIGKTNADLGNAAGVVFRHSDWEFANLWTPSKRKSNNARPIRVWRLK